MKDKIIRYKRYTVCYDYFGVTRFGNNFFEIREIDFKVKEDAERKVQELLNKKGCCDVTLKESIRYFNVTQYKMATKEQYEMAMAK